MIFYITSQTYQQVIYKSIQESEEICVGNKCENELYLLPYLKSNLAQFNIDSLIVDLNAVQDTDTEIIEAFEMLRIMGYETRIILLASNRSEGDELLVKCFQMGIYDIIDSDDFLVISEELVKSIKFPNQYKDAVRFKEAKTQEKIIVKKEIKRTVNKIMVGMAGSQTRIGVTHNLVVLGNALRKKGFMVAAVEINGKKDFTSIREDFDLKMLDDSYFSIGGIDFYPDASLEKLGSILAKSYNFILVDFGVFLGCDTVTFNKSDVKIIVSGSKPWEINSLNTVFSSASEDALKNYFICFNLTEHQPQTRENIRENMGELSRNVYFLEYSENPFVASNFDVEGMLHDYMPVKIEPERKKTFFRKEKNEKEKKKS